MDKKTLFSRSTLFTGDEQLKTLQNSTVLIAGVGGLGCVVSHLLVRRGIGKIILMDCKKIDPPDLNRQMLYTVADIGKNKTDRAKEYLRKIHLFSNVQSINTEISDSSDFTNLMKELEFDIVADCLDNYKSRFILESHLKNENQFLVHGGVRDDYGQITTIKKGLSLKKLYEGLIDSKDIIPVIPEIVNITGSMMVKEIINCLSGEPELQQKLLVIELSDFSMFKIDLE